MTWESEGRSRLVRCYRHITTDTFKEQFFLHKCSLLDMCILIHIQHRTILILKIKSRMIIGCHLALNLVILNRERLSISLKIMWRNFLFIGINWSIICCWWNAVISVWILSTLNYTVTYLCTRVPEFWIDLAVTWEIRSTYNRFIVHEYT